MTNEQNNQLQALKKAVQENQSNLAFDFCSTWRSIIRPALAFAETFTPHEVAVVIDEILAIGDGVCPAN